MPRICYVLFIGFILLAACTNSKKETPCDGIMCDYMPPVCRLKLIDPATGHDLVYGPNARIPLDSIKIQMPDTIMQIKQRIDTSSHTAVLYFIVYGPQSLRVGRPGKVTLDKITFLQRSVGCCGTEIYSMLLNDSPVPVKRDTTGTFLIPYTL